MHMIDPAWIIPGGSDAYWRRLGWIDGEQGEGFGLDRGRGDYQGKAVSLVQGGGHLVECPFLFDRVKKLVYLCLTAA